MALIHCHECSKTVSTTAPACPHCGAPVAGADSERLTFGKKVSTIQETSKHLKLHIAFASLFLWAGVIWVFVATNGGEKPPASVGVAISFILFGGIWYLATKIRIWWHHK